MNKINIPPIKIKNKIYEYQKVFISPVNKQINNVWNKSDNPIVIGWVIWENNNVLNKINIMENIWKIQIIV